MIVATFIVQLAVLHQPYGRWVLRAYGDRMFADDGLSSVALVGLTACLSRWLPKKKGADLKQRIARNFGCLSPEAGLP